MKLMMTGGGTGGHLVIARSLARSARARGDEVHFVGSLSGQDRQWFEGSGEFDSTHFLDTTGVVNKKGLAKLSAMWKILKAITHARRLIADADAVISVGGFSAAPAAIAAVMMGKPLYIHEQNAFVGRLNRLLRPYARGFFSSYTQEGRCDYPIDPIYFEHAYIRHSVHRVIFLGGSQGAKYINDLALQLAPWLHNGGIKIIHQCGVQEQARVEAAYEAMGIEAEVYGFTSEMPSLMQRSDFAISRSGASTLWELCAAQIPTFFIPFPYAAGDHQYHNAQYILQHNAGWCERQGDGVMDALKAAIRSDIEPRSKALSSLIQPKGAEYILQQIQKDRS